MVKEKIDISVVVPAYNEEKRIEYAIGSINDYLLKKGFSYEILIVNDGSTDNTLSLSKKCAKKYSNVTVIDLIKNQGKGGAVKAGILSSKGEYILFTDTDQSTPITEFDKLLLKMEEEHYDLAIGSRDLKESKIEKGQAWYRELSGKLFGLLTKLLVIRGISDTQCGFKCLKKEAAHKIFSKMTSPSAIFDVEMLALASKYGYRIAEVPVIWIHNPDTRIPYNLKKSIGVFKELFRIKKQHNLIFPLKAKN